MADNVLITPGSGNTVAADEVADGILGTVKVQFTKLMDGTLDSTNKLIVTSSGAAKVDGSAVTQPVSGTVTATGPLTDAQLRATPVPISGTVTSTPSGTQNVSVTNASGASAVNIQDGGNSITVDGTFFQATQPISGTVDTELPAAALLADNTATPTVPGVGAFLMTSDGTNWDKVISSIGDAASASGMLNVVPMMFNGTNNDRLRGSVSGGLLMGQCPASLAVTATAATGVAVTATLPAVASQFHYITFIEIHKYFTATNAASATPLVVTTTNLPGSLAYTFGQPLGTIGTTDERIYTSNSPLKSSVVNTNTTIVCPATTGIIWRVNVYYYTAI